MNTIDTTTAWAPQRAAVRRALRDAGMSQAALARKIGVSGKYMSQMLTGKSDGRLEYWEAMATSLGMTWQLTLLDPNDSIITWAREMLGLEIEPWQAHIMRKHLAGF